MKVRRRLKGLFAAVPTIKSLLAYRAGEAERALKQHLAANRWRDPDIELDAFEATLWILNYRSDVARDIFAGIIDRIALAVPRTEAREYVLQYSRFYLALIDKDDRAGAILEKANHLQPSRFAARWLGLPLSLPDEA